jgi:hypothetical protein
VQLKINTASTRSSRVGKCIEKEEKTFPINYTLHNDITIEQDGSFVEI